MSPQEKAGWKTEAELWNDPDCWDPIDSGAVHGSHLDLGALELQRRSFGVAAASQRVAQPVPVQRTSTGILVVDRRRVH
jgi:hypothetical protein